MKAKHQSQAVPAGINKVSQALVRQIDKHKLMVERHLQKSKRVLDKME